MTTMPTTAEEAHREALRAYRSMLRHVDRSDFQLAASASEIFRNAANLAQVLELRQIRMALLVLAAPDVDVHDLHAAPGPDALPVDLVASHPVGAHREAT